MFDFDTHYSTTCMDVANQVLQGSVRFVLQKSSSMKMPEPPTKYSAFENKDLLAENLIQRSLGKGIPGW